MVSRSVVMQHRHTNRQADTQVGTERILLWMSHGSDAKLSSSISHYMPMGGVVVSDGQ